jgi:hypothetical protein
MATKVASWGWLVAAIAFLLVAIRRFARDKPNAATFLVLGLVFLILGVMLARRKGASNEPPRSG